MKSVTTGAGVSLGPVIWVIDYDWIFMIKYLPEGVFLV